MAAFQEAPKVPYSIVQCAECWKETEELHQLPVEAADNSWYCADCYAEWSMVLESEKLCSVLHTLVCQATSVSAISELMAEHACAACGHPELPVLTSYDCPPIPDRSIDWAAWVDGQEEIATGRGPSREAAIQDLFDQLEFMLPARKPVQSEVKVGETQKGKVA